MKKTCAAFIFDGFADHQLALAIANLRQSGDFSIETFSLGGGMVSSWSGLRVIPNTSLRYMDPEDFDLLLLPGGDRWEKGDNLEVFPLIKATAGHRPLAAICSATLALADLGLLNTIPHTSNFPGYLEQYCPDYTGSHLYRSQPCVNATDIITINGTALIGLAHSLLSCPLDISPAGTNIFREPLTERFNTLREIYATDHEFFDSTYAGT